MDAAGAMCVTVIAAAGCVIISGLEKEMYLKMLPSHFICVQNC